MTKFTKSEVNYQVLSQELESIVTELQRDDLDIDDALKQYKRGQEIVALLESYLKTAENTVTELKTNLTKQA